MTTKLTWADKWRRKQTWSDTMRQALTIAGSLVEAAFQANVIAIEAMTDHELDIRQGWTTVPDLVSFSQAAELLGISRQRVLQRIGEHSLPATRVGRDYVIPRSAVEVPG